jgi:hypothetical protein
VGSASTEDRVRELGAVVGEDDREELAEQCRARGPPELADDARARRGVLFRLANPTMSRSRVKLKVKITLPPTVPSTVSISVTSASALACV